MSALREQYEAAESAWLAGWAVRSAGAKRKHPEPPHPYRTAFQRDRDRVLHSSAFRRLDFKTQVFVPHESDHCRTRMTHTLEVALVARTVARALRANEDLAEAVALAHDLGHPPFGHGGERELNELMAGHGGFEHNRQSLRVVDFLEHPYPDFRGLNLTDAARECIARHETLYDAPACEDFPPGLAGPVEGQIVDLADEIAYTSADLDDALAAGWLRIEQIGGLELWREAWSAAEQAWPSARPIHIQIRACKGVLEALASDVIATSSANLASVGAASVDDVRRAGRRLVALSPTARERLDETQAFLRGNVYEDQRNARQDSESRAVLRVVFESLVTRSELLPERYRGRVEQQGLHRVVCDYVAGMTDRFCRQEHSRVRG